VRLRRAETNSRFRFLLAAYIFSLLPVHTVTFVLLTRLFEMTGTTLATSFLWLAYALPSIVLGPVAGAVVDVRDRKQVLFAINLLRAAAVAGLALAGTLSLALIYGLVLFNSVLNQFYAPAEMACLPCLLGPERLPRATSLLIVVQQATMFVGFSGGGGVVALLGVRGALGACAAMSAAACALVLALPTMKVLAAGPDRARAVLRGRVAEGYRYLTRHGEVLGPFLLLLSGQGILAMVIVNVPAVAAEIVRVPVSAAGAAIVAPFAAGTLLGAVRIPRLLTAGASRRRLVETSLLVLGLSLAGLITAVPALSGWLRIAAGAFVSAAFGAAVIGLLVPARTALLERAPGGLQGRIFGSLAVLVNLVSLVPVIFSGTVAHLTGVRVTLGVLGLVCLLGLAFSRRTGGAILAPDADLAAGPVRSGH
jgi:MFS family permease